ncbi:hypothetical protein Nepgr_026999 [Nepenthes gracilis]|uniref:Uncharacterized protein n=1 Tax=Nepenthes gracilis TaxID=150966 RepID=A0AAD3Y341_NEPGR|nr:hypothetical protein Nepgr_026999 [Nepenthes gracilis]
MVNNRCHFRSISLPSMSNPIIRRIGEELDKLKEWEESSTSTSETISIGLTGLGNLYKCLDDALSLPLIQQAPSFHHHEQCVNELLETSLRLLDICSAAREIVLQLKEADRELRSALRRRKHDPVSIESNTADYICKRKKTIKSAKALVLSLKRVEENFGSSSILEDDHHHHRLSTVINALRCVSFMNISIYESLFFFLSMPVLCCKPRSSKWPLVSKLMQMRVTDQCGNEAETWNELKNVDVALRSLSCCQKSEPEKVEFVVKRLEDLEVGMDAIENGLDSMFRQLIKTRASLLNLFSFSF